MIGTAGGPAARIALELNGRRLIWKNVETVRKTPGYEDVYLMETAPQLGVRISRVLSGLHTLTMSDVMAGKTFPDVVAAGGARNGGHQERQIPCGALVPSVSAAASGFPLLDAIVVRVTNQATVG
jgi:hypothetical protein